MLDTVVIVILVVILFFCAVRPKQNTAVAPAGGSEEPTRMPDPEERLAKARKESLMKARKQQNEGAYMSRGASTVRGYSQVTSPEAYAARQMAERFGPGADDGFDPDSRDQVSAQHEVTPPSWSDDALLFYGAVDAQTIENHKQFTSDNWLFNQNAAFADYGDNQNSPFPRTGIWGFLINNVPTSTNPHQVTEDQDDGGAQRNTYTDRRISYGVVN